MKFKNELEQQVFEIASNACGGSVIVEHNKVIEVENASGRETASFTGPPKKEVDVIIATIRPDLVVLVSCKLYSNARADPSVVQEWAAVVNAMNRYTKSAHYLGLVICPSGFTSGCEAWATSNNIALVPPVKGKQVTFRPGTCVEMVGRALRALHRRVVFRFDDLLRAPYFYDFAYDLTADFEGREQYLREDSAHYVVIPAGWISSFGELISTLLNKTIVEVISTTDWLGLKLSDRFLFLFGDTEIRFGLAEGAEISGKTIDPECRKNRDYEPCSFELISELAVGKQLRSAADMRTHFEFGITGNINIGFHKHFLHVVRTLNPPDCYRL